MESLAFSSKDLFRDHRHLTKDLRDLRFISISALSIQEAAEILSIYLRHQSFGSAFLQGLFNRWHAEKSFSNLVSN